MLRLSFGLLLSLCIIPLSWADNDLAHGKDLTATCVACHGVDGNSQIPMFPKLAGQQPDYLIKQLKDIQSGARTVVQMGNLLAPFSNQDLSDIAAYFARQKVSVGEADASKLTAGESLYRFGNPSSGVPACSACHGPRGQGLNAAKFPALGGQHASYTQTQLNNYKNGTRDNDASEIMQTIANTLTDEEIDAVSDYLQGLY